MKTIELGIDLGTTNSSIAVVRNGDPEIIKNASGEDSTPSLVFAEKSGQLLVGSKAKRRALEDASGDAARNWKAEIKRLMGTRETVKLPNLSSALSPETISSEILKSLLADVARRHPNVNRAAAVITVPAHFSTLQSEATMRAGQQAGIYTVVLLQEPIAAAISYGFTTNSDENWLVYDLGGGTFDVALVASRGGSLTVLAHAGDNFLGGKDIDSAIVDNFLGPQLKTKFPQLDFKADAIANQRLRAYAEQAKIDLSSAESTTVEVSFDYNGGRVTDTFAFSRGDLEAACKGILQKTVALCQETIKKSHVDPSSVKRIVLVGGPTQMPVLRDFVGDSLGIAIDGSQDPLTVVARGAALFAQQIPVLEQAAGSPDDSQSKAFCKLELNFNPVTSESQQTVTGRASSTEGAEPAHSICFQAEDKSYNSGDILLKNGKFICQLPTGNRGNRFWIYVKSQNGALLASQPDSIAISKGVAISGSPLPHSIGVSILSIQASKGFGQIDEVMDHFFARNSILPLSATKRYYTVSDVSPADDSNALPIRVYEGESNTPNRNSLVCDLAITGKMVPRQLRKGSPVDITIAVDESRQLTVKAYLPEVDLVLNARATIYDEDITVGELESNLEEQVTRGKQVSSTEPSMKKQIEETVSEIQSTLEKSGADSDQRRRASKQIRDLMVMIDETEARAEFDRNVGLFLKRAEESLQYLATAEPKERRSEYNEEFITIKQEGLRAIESKDAVILKQIIEKLGRIYWRWLMNDPAVLVDYVESVKKNAGAYKDQNELQNVLRECEKAIANKNSEELRLSVRKLLDLKTTDGKAETAPLLRKAGITRL